MKDRFDGRSRKIAAIVGLVFLSLTSWAIIKTGFSLPITSSDPLPFSRQAWIRDIPWGSRKAMAVFLTRNQTLRGMSSSKVRDLLGFGQFPSDYEAPGADNSTILVMNVGSCWNYHTFGSLFYVTIKDGKVTDESFAEDY